ncbi:MAG: hypothetical protein H0Z38_01440 [Firmicutes bacterium]|nr:hypothetical protein [Bacillota bacterium]
MSSWSKLVQAIGTKGQGPGKMPTFLIVALAALGFLLIFGADFLAPAEPSLPQGQTAPRAPEMSTESEPDYVAQYEESLRKTVSAIAGVGEVTVDVFLASSPRKEYARSTDATEKTVQDQSTSGAVSKVTSEVRSNSQITLRRAGTWEEPLVVQTFAPAIQGVLVVAEGAEDPRVRLELSRAVQTALGIPAHRVRVMSKEGR